MAINLFEYGVKTANLLDQAFVPASAFGFLATNPSKINFTGAKEVEVINIDMSGLGDYDRSNGFPQGSLSETRSLYQLAMDRGRTFSFDAVDEDEAGVKGADYMALFQKKFVVPEVDAYTASKLYYFASQASNLTNVSLAVNNVIASLASAVDTAMEKGGDTEDYVIIVPRYVKTLVDTSTEQTRYLNVGDFKKGNVNYKVSMINDVPIIPVTSKLMYSGFDFLNGVDAAQYGGGFVAHSGAVPIQYIVMPKSAAAIITKTQKIRTFAANVNQQADAWKMDYRRCYDVISTLEQQKCIVAGY